MLAALAAGCAPVPTAPPAPPAPSVLPPYSIVLKDYKRSVADRIVQVSGDTYSQPLPEVMKSIVVLQISLDGKGEPAAVSVLRSNGYTHLEQRALASVAKAAPFAPPAATLLRGAATITFLETFLFRDDDFFQVRSLVPEGREKLF